MSWDDDDDWESNTNLVAPPSAPVESEEDEEVVSSDDETALESSKPKKATDPNKVKAKAVSKAKQKELETKLLQEQEAAKSQKSMTKEERISEKLRLQKLVEESDMAIADDLFNLKKEAGVFDSASMQTLLQTVPLDTEDHYKDFASAIGTRIEIEDNALFAKEFLKEIGRAVGRAISGGDLAEVISVLGVVKNEKVKQKLGKKKKKTGKAFANVARNDDFDMESAKNGAYGGGGMYDDLDGDFM